MKSIHWKFAINLYKSLISQLSIEKIIYKILSNPHKILVQNLNCVTSALSLYMYASFSHKLASKSPQPNDINHILQPLFKCCTMIAFRFSICFFWLWALVSRSLFCCVRSCTSFSSFFINCSFLSRHFLAASRLRARFLSILIFNLSFSEQFDDVGISTLLAEDGAWGMYCWSWQAFDVDSDTILGSSIVDLRTFWGWLDKEKAPLSWSSVFWDTNKIVDSLQDWGKIFSSFRFCALISLYFSLNFLKSILQLSLALQRFFTVTYLSTCICSLVRLFVVRMVLGDNPSIWDKKSAVNKFGDANITFPRLVKSEFEGENISFSKKEVLEMGEFKLLVAIFSEFGLNCDLFSSITFEETHEFLPSLFSGVFIKRLKTFRWLVYFYRNQWWFIL